MYSVDVDTGGTMTDALVTGGEQPLVVKVETTPHDITVSFMACLESAASMLGFESIAAFLDKVELLRWSSTVTSNVLAQRAGPKLGLIVSQGHEADIYGKRDEAKIIFGWLVRPENVVGLPAAAADRDVLAVLKRLLEDGIRRVSVSLAGAFPDNDEEQRVVRIISEQYPDHYLGSLPVLAGADILMRQDDVTRTLYTLINSYVHGSLASSLFRAEDLLQVDHGWRGNLLVGHINGGVARVGKTKAVDTIEAGPLFGTFGAAKLAREARLKKVIALDVGGTTAKVSAVADGKPVMLREGDLFGIPLRTSMPLLRSIAIGGGSIARVADGQLRLGPDSMGAAPGPACYGLGGREATLTDAFVVLGLISPTGFLGGRRTLNVQASCDAVERKVAKPLGLSVEAAAERIAAKAYELIAGLVRDVAGAAGWKPAEAVMFAYGGNGPLFAAAVAERLNIPEVRLFAFGSAFSAYGSALSDVTHVYESGVVGSDRPAEARRIAGVLSEQAQRDLRGEGFDPGGANARWEFLSHGGQTATAEGFNHRALDRALSNGAGKDTELVRLVVSYPVGRFENAPLGASSEAPSLVGTRHSPIVSGGELAVHDWKTLRGHKLAGPAVVDGGTFTWVISPGWSGEVDLRGDAVLKYRKGA